ncbi:hypothetical protein E9529_06620 [Blastococcus sp. KM273128]|uniref:hypothetical protein n=1 Tax=Blastococcus sp. KM273128 TaxID=2570314 RepID=UPI001F1A30AD|nr:hypothetical protein [Blastococcus sp. KM273128]MCF6743952.1 hypothetical protein [Blastococcus sp. KM273128]
MISLGAIVIALVGLTYGAWSSTDAISVLETDTRVELESATPTSVTVTGLSSVTIQLTDVVSQSVYSPVGGTVTFVTASSTLRAGDVIATVDDRPIVAFTGDAPLIADVAPGDRGPNVARGLQYLKTLGFYAGDVTVIAPPSFSRAAQKYNMAMGRANDGQVLAAAGTAWIGTEDGAAFASRVMTGDVIPQHALLGAGAIVSATATVTEGSGVAPVARGKRLVGTIDGVAVSYEEGSGRIEPATARALAALGRTDFLVQLTLPESFEALAIPSGALIGSGLNVCVVEVASGDMPGKVARVTTLGEQPGLVLLEHAPGVPKRVIANPWELPTQPACDE